MGKSTKFIIPNLILITIFFGATVTIQADTFNLELKKLSNQSMNVFDPKDPDFLFRRTSSQYIRYDPEGNQVTLPDQKTAASLLKKDRDKYECAYPFKGVIRLLDDHYLFALDSDDMFVKGYNKLYLDRNQNGDLTDDALIEAIPPPEGISYGEGSSQREFPKQEITLTVDGTKIEYAFFFAVYSNMQSKTEAPNFARADVRSAIYREGTIEIAGKKHQIVLLDFNSNGRFDDVYRVDENVTMGNDRVYLKPGDKLFLDPDKKNQNMAYYLSDRKDTFPVSKLLWVEDRFYNLSVTPKGDQITLTPSTIPTGNVKNPNRRFNAVYSGNQGIVKIYGEASKPVVMPEGEWKLMEYSIDATESSSQNDPERPTRTAATGTKQSPIVKVKSGETVDLPFGPPFKPLVIVQDMGIQRDEKRTVALELLLQGTGNEICRELMVNGQTPDPPPAFVIATKDKEIIERGSFEYG